MTQMKGITCCGDCGYYNWKKHKCTRATDEGDARDNFYADCPLPDVPAVDAVPVEWLRHIILTCDDEESKAAYMLLHKWNDERFDNDGKIAIEK